MIKEVAKTKNDDLKGTASISLRGIPGINEMKNFASDVCGIDFGKYGVTEVLGIEFTKNSNYKKE